MLMDSLKDAFSLIAGFDPEFLEIVVRSLYLAAISTVISTIVGTSIGLFISERNFFGKRTLITLINTGMAVPTVVIGIVFYCILSRSGPLGMYDLLYTKFAIIIGQLCLGIPIVISFVISGHSQIDSNIIKLVDMFRARGTKKHFTLLNEMRFAIATAVIACFGRVVAEVGVAMILGGNIKGYTRTITTAIALEHDKGELSLALALGLVLLVMSFIINLSFQHYKKS